MTRYRIWNPTLLVGCVLVAGVAGTARAQGPTIDPGNPSARLGGESRLGPIPGSGANSDEGQDPGSGPLSGRVGTGTPRVPQSITIPGGRVGPNAPPSMGAPTELPITGPPIYGVLSIPESGTDEGPANGLSLDEAIERLVRDNLGLRSRFLEIPQARADVLTASLRANPVLYADGQMIPYGQYSRERPGGPLQYDLNITYPLDISGKRRARTIVAERAVRVLESRYQDAVRLSIDNLYTAYVDVLAARQTVWYSKASVEGLDRIYKTTQELKDRGGMRTEADVNRVRVLRDASEVGLVDAEETLRKTRRILATLLNLPLQGSDSIELRGSLRDTATPPPPVEELQRVAMANRPDIISFRLGIARAEADVRLAEANRLSDVFVLYQPFTYQNNAPYGVQSATSWALGVTVPLPVFNRNQGNIQRAVLNVSQSRIELSEIERQVLADVETAAREYEVSRNAVGRLERDMLPAARQVRNDTFRLFSSGEVEIVEYLNAQRDYNEIVRQYRDTLARHRRSMLSLNSALGIRLLP